jgi:hypothetical protein
MHAIRNHMGNVRFHQIRHHLTIFNHRRGTHLSNSWYVPIQLLIYQLRGGFQTHFLSGTNIAIDDAIAKAKGRSNKLSKNIRHASI